MPARIGKILVGADKVAAQQCETVIVEYGYGWSSFCHMVHPGEGNTAPVDLLHCYRHNVVEEE